MAIRDARIRRMGAAFAVLGLLLFAQPANAAAPDAPTIGTATAGDGLAARAMMDVWDRRTGKAVVG